MFNPYKLTKTTAQFVAADNPLPVSFAVLAYAASYYNEIIQNGKTPQALDVIMNAIPGEPVLNQNNFVYYLVEKIMFLYTQFDFPEDLVESNFPKNLSLELVSFFGDISDEENPFFIGNDPHAPFIWPYGLVFCANNEVYGTISTPDRTIRTVLNDRLEHEVLVPNLFGISKSDLRKISESGKKISEDVKEQIELVRDLEEYQPFPKITNHQRDVTSRLFELLYQSNNV